MFRIGKRRAVIAGATTALLIMGAVAIGANAASGDGTTNGDPITFGQVTCQTSVGLTQKEDLVAQAIVPNQVNQGDSYTITIPGGSASLPSTITSPTLVQISSYMNLATTYEFVSSSGAVSITNAVASGNANWNGTDFPITVTDPTPTSLKYNIAGPLPTLGPNTTNTLTTPTITLTVTAPMADATVTSFLDEIDTATQTSLLPTPVSVTCKTPHASPQTDGISATLVGAGGPTTSSQPTCRPVGAGACVTTTTTTHASTTTTSIGGTTTTSVPTGPTISISDAQVERPDKGSAKMLFTVTISSAPIKKATVHYETADGSALQPTDYRHKRGSVSFSPTVLSRTIAVKVIGGTIGEPNKNFFVNLSLPTGASILDGQGLGTIVDSHSPGVSIADASIPVPTRGTSLKFTITLTKPVLVGSLCSVSFATSDGSAKAGVDYSAKHGSVSVGRSKTTATISVTVKPTATAGDSFLLVLSNPKNCQIVDGIAEGMIT
jgi:hypothetical protein